MDNKLAIKLEGTAAAGVKKCLARFAAASACTWRLESSHSARNCADALGARACAAVHIQAKARGPFSAVMLYRHEDTALLQECFLGDVAALPDDGLLTETLHLELGNILLNGAINALLNAAGRSDVPSVPEFFEEAGELAGALKALHLPEGPCLAVSCVFWLGKGGREARGEILLLLPPEAAHALGAPHF